MQAASLRQSGGALLILMTLQCDMDPLFEIMNMLLMQYVVLSRKTCYERGSHLCHVERSSGACQAVSRRKYQYATTLTQL